MERTDFKNIIIEKIPSPVVFEGFFEVAEVSFRNFIKTKTILNSLHSGQGCQGFFLSLQQFERQENFNVGFKKTEKMESKISLSFFSFNKYYDGGNNELNE